MTVLEGVELGTFDVVERGIYYIDRLDSGTSVTDRPDGQTRLRYFDFSTQRSTTVASGLGRVGSGLSATRDGRIVFFSRIDSSINELVIVSNFR